MVSISVFCQSDRDLHQHWAYSLTGCPSPWRWTPYTVNAATSLKTPNKAAEEGQGKCVFPWVYCSLLRGCHHGHLKINHAFIVSLTSFLPIPSFFRVSLASFLPIPLFFSSSNLKPLIHCSIHIIFKLSFYCVISWIFPVTILHTYFTQPRQ